MAMLLYSRPKCVLLTVKQAAAAAARKGEGPPPGQEVFDSNCITPGTAFMARLGDHLRFFIRHKMATDPVWQRPRIIFSGAAISVWGWMPSGPAEGHGETSHAASAQRAAVRGSCLLLNPTIDMPLHRGGSLH